VESSGAVSRATRQGLRDPGRTVARDAGHNDLSLCLIKRVTLLSYWSLHALIGCTKNSAKYKIFIGKREKAQDNRIERNGGGLEHTRNE
jgi:hypothetical protein